VGEFGEDMLIAGPLDLLGDTERLSRPAIAVTSDSEAACIMWNNADPDTMNADIYCSTVAIGESPVVNQPPVLEAIGNKVIREGRALSFRLKATDPEGDDLTYSAVNLPKGARFNVKGRFLWRPRYNQAGTYKDIKFIVSDGELSASETIQITVKPLRRRRPFYRRRRAIRRRFLRFIRK